MSSSPEIRIIDENLNRLAEGLRILEDLARMVLDDSGLTAQLKALRHGLIRSDLEFNLELLGSRDAAGDVGADMEVSGESREKDLPLIAIANARRAQESLRTLEEIAKLPEMSGRLDSSRFKNARFELYTLEKGLVAKLMRQDRAGKIKGLYVIIDSGVLAGRSHLEAVRQVVRAGVKVVQLRDKTLSKRELVPLARQLQEFCRESGVLFIVNDYLDVALAAGADGLHIGQGDLPAAEARRLLPPDRILGVSAATAGQVREAVAGGADYIGVGGIYPTSSKDDAELVGVERVREIRSITKLPLVAIGGINENNTGEAVRAGAGSVCVISAVLNAPDMEAAARRIIAIIEAENEKIDR